MSGGIDVDDRAGGIGAVGGRKTVEGDYGLKTVGAIDAEAAQAHNRYITTVGNTEPLMGHMTWTEDEAVTSVRFKVSAAVKVVFDAAPVDDVSDTSQAWNWLQTHVPAVAQVGAVDVEYFEISSVAAGIDEWSDWFDFGGYLRRADFLAATTGVTIFAEVR